MKTWRVLISDEMSDRSESFSDVVSCTLSDQELDVEFCDAFGATEGKPFTLWTRKRVYFPVMYDGEEWVGSVSRDPDGEATTHFGG